MTKERAHRDVALRSERARAISFGFGQSKKTDFSVFGESRASHVPWPHKERLGKKQKRRGDARRDNPALCSEPRRFPRLWCSRKFVLAAGEVEQREVSTRLTTYKQKNEAKSLHSRILFCIILWTSRADDLL